MKVLLLLAALLLVAPASASLDAAPEAAAACNGVVLDNEFTGVCTDGCYGGTAYIDGRWFAYWPCPFAA